MKPAANLEMQPPPHRATGMDWRGRDVVSIRDFERKEIDAFLDLAERFVPASTGQKRNTSLEGRILATLFYEPSTRTRLSFEAAMQRLGGGVIGFSDPSVTSNKKGETLADTVRIVDKLADVLVLRHPKEGSARLAAEYAEHPVVNAGDGAGEHPTQTLLDLFTIQRDFRKIDGLTIVLLGDLKFGRTVHSLVTALAHYSVKMILVSPPSLQLPEEVLHECRERGATMQSTSDLEAALAEADVLYVTRIQQERFVDPEEYRKVAGTYRITNALLKKGKRNLIVLHPLPRVDEIHPEVDASPHARYFQQAANGLPVRMALLASVLGGKP
jgi:aspartate carbamoyltransferase catalytic subunit